MDRKRQMGKKSVKKKRQWKRVWKEDETDNKEKCGEEKQRKNKTG
jgi:hypothetical protein